MEHERETMAVVSLGIIFGIAVNALAIYGLIALLSG